MNRRQACGEPLMKLVRYNSRVTFHPRHIYCYSSIKKSLSILIENCNFWDMCNECLHQDTSDHIFSTIYHGKVWKDFQIYKERNFLADRHNLAFMLNVDWFRPFEYTFHSVGGIGERAKRARHSQVCSIENRGYIYYIYIIVRANFVLITCKEGGEEF